MHMINTAISSPCLDDYIGTLHWVTARDGLDSVINAYNYYGYAFPKAPRESTDAEVTVRFFNEDGSENEPFQAPLSTGGTLHLAVSSHIPGFQGATSVQMIPKGRMKRLTYKGTGPHRPIASSYFVMYQSQAGFQDFSHELFAVRKDPEKKMVEWATVVYPSRDLKPGVVVLNNRLLCQGEAFASQVKIELRHHDSRPALGPHKFSLLPGGSRFIKLNEVFPALDPMASRSLLMVVRGNNIEQPLSFHAHRNGDFNFHHF